MALIAKTLVAVQAQVNEQGDMLKAMTDDNGGSAHGPRGKEKMPRTERDLAESGPPDVKIPHGDSTRPFEGEKAGKTVVNKKAMGNVIAVAMQAMPAHARMAFASSDALDEDEKKEAMKHLKAMEDKEDEDERKKEMAMEHEGKPKMPMRHEKELKAAEVAGEGLGQVFGTERRGVFGSRSASTERRLAALEDQMYGNASTERALASVRDHMVGMGLDTSAFDELYAGMDSRALASVGAGGSSAGVRMPDRLIAGSSSNFVKGTPEVLAFLGAKA